MIMNIDEAIEKLHRAGYLVEADRQIGYHDIGSVIDAVFNDDEFGEPKDFGVNSFKAGEFIGRAMEDYDVLTFYKWNYDTDTLTVGFNYGDKKLTFENFVDNVIIEAPAENVGNLKYKAKVKLSPELEKFVDKVDDEWQDCFGY